VPGASGSTTPVVAEPEPFTGRPAMRAHNTSFFGARKARTVSDSELEVDQHALAVSTVADTPVAPATTAEAPAAEVTGAAHHTTQDEQVEEQIDVQADPEASPAAPVGENTPIFQSMMSASGLPMRRPGTTMNPGETDAPAEMTAAPATSRRDPEAVRRNLTRHKNGVSAARTEAQDGTHREEADVQH
jgi:hypothetical protein